MPFGKKSDRHCHSLGSPESQTWATKDVGCDFKHHNWQEGWDRKRASERWADKELEPKMAASVPPESPHTTEAFLQGIESQEARTKPYLSVAESHSWESSVLNWPCTEPEEGPGRRTDRELKAFTMQRSHSKESWPRPQATETQEGTQEGRHLHLIPLSPFSFPPQPDEEMQNPTFYSWSHQQGVCDSSHPRCCYPKRGWQWLIPWDTGGKEMWPSIHAWWHSGWESWTQMPPWPWFFFSNHHKQGWCLSPTTTNHCISVMAFEGEKWWVSRGKRKAH